MHETFKPTPTLHIVIEIRDADVQVVASDEFQELKHPNIKKSKKKSDWWLKQVNDIVGSIKGRKFKILKAYPSKKSYTYYIQFQPTDREGNLWDQELELQIELRDHTSETHLDLGQVGENFFVKAYYLEDELVEGPYKLMQKIWKILDECREGNFDAFLM